MDAPTGADNDVSDHIKIEAGYEPGDELLNEKDGTARDVRVRSSEFNLPCLASLQIRSHISTAVAPSISPILCGHLVKESIY